MKLLKLNKIRLLLACFILACWVWLTWNVLPLRGVIRLDESLPIMPENGATIIVFKNNQIVRATALDILCMGWAGVKHAWPYVGLGFLSALAIGYLLGELSRRKFGIEKASEEALKEMRDLFNKTLKMQDEADCRMFEAEKKRDDFLKLKIEALNEKKYFLDKKRHYEEQIGYYEGEIERTKYIERELNKAKEKIKRSENKIGKPPRNTFDDKKN